MFEKKQKLPLKITGLAFGGNGVAKVEMGASEFIIFVENAVTGDKVEAELIKVKKNYAVGRAVKILEPSKLRVKPRCKHFEVCGGCVWQFLRYEDQARFKEQHVRDALERIGGIKNPPLLPIWESPSQWFYRNKMEYSFCDGKLGFHLAGKHDEVFDLEECYLQSKFSVDIAKFVKKFVALRGLRGFLNLAVREARSTGEFMVNLITEKSAKIPKVFVAEIAKKFPGITSLYHTEIRVQKGRRTKKLETLLLGKPMLTEIVRAQGESLIFDIAPDAFFQPNTKAAELLVNALFLLGKPKKSDTVFDLYCGTGLFGMFFAKKAKKAYGVEVNENAVKNAAQNAKKNGLRNIEFFSGDTDKMFKKIPDTASLVIVDPPRSGLTEKTLKYLVGIGPPKILYVSCNPATLGRDIQKLKQMYTLEKAQPIDLFPHTYHIETVCLLRRRGWH